MKYSDEFIEEYAKAIRHELLNDPEFMMSGRRNSDTVDFLIACHCLGMVPDESYAMATSMVPRLRDKRNDSRIQFDIKFATVRPYLKRWGPEGKEKQAINYLTIKYSSAWDKAFAKKERKEER